MTSSFDGAAVLITGGGGGIGKAAARRFLEEGASVVLSGTRAAVLEQAQAEVDPGGARSLIVPGQISGQADAQRLVQAAVDRFGRLDVLVNSTGIFRPVPFLEQSEDQLEEALGSILRPTFWVSQAAAAVMSEEGGAIVNVGSMWALDAISTTPTSAYSAAQAGRHALTKNLAIELAPAGIRVNTEEARAVLDSVDGFHPLGRRGQPEDVVEAVLFLAGPHARWITGATLPIDGGVLAGRAPASQPVAASVAA
jgi:NAD(P)-dependent dehydrogenase (short-subunit alcohol dehydrogenase family)